MAIARVPYPAQLDSQAKFLEHGALIETRFLDASAIAREVVDGNIAQGCVFQIGGVVYQATSDTAITGTASDYVKITPDGATATASYVANLSGVTWAKQFNGYYDVSDNLYIFDEGKALAAGEIAAVFGKYVTQTADGTILGDVKAERDVKAGQDVTSVRDIVSGRHVVIPLGSNLRSDFQTNPELAGGGRAAGFYTGTSATLTDYPIGTILAVFTGTRSYNLNSSTTLYINTISNFFIVRDIQASSDYSALSGTWRARGYAGYSANDAQLFFLFQRT